MYSFAIKDYGMLISAAEVLPYFVRANFKKSPNIPNNTTDPEEIKLLELMRLPIDEFADRVKAGDFPSGICSQENDNLMDYPEFAAEANFSGVFRLLKELIPDGVELESIDPEHWDHTAQYAFNGSDLVFYLPLQHQPSIFERYQYGSAREVIDEVQTTIEEALEIEMPKDFPYWRFIGVLDGVAADD